MTMTAGEQRFRRRIDHLYAMDSRTLRRILGEDLGKLTAESSYWDYEEVRVIEKMLSYRRYAKGDPDA